jgi:hypothetical protein
MRVNPRAVRAPDLRRGITGAVVDEEDVDGKPTRLLRQPGEDTTERSLLIASNHDRKTALKERLARTSLTAAVRSWDRHPHAWILHRHQGPAAGGLRCRQPQ